MALNLSNTDIDTLLAEVAQDLKNLGLDRIEKAEPVALKKGVDEVPEGSEESSPVADSAGPPASPEASGPPAAEAAPAGPDAGPPPQGEAPPADPAQAQPALTPEALLAEYKQLPPEELIMHVQAAQAALQALQGGGAGPGAGGPPPTEPSAPPAGPPPGMDAPALKSEKQTNDLVKSEIASLKEDVEILSNTIRQMLETPVRKAIVNLSELRKDEDETPAPVAKSLAPDEFWSRMREVSKRNDLSKSEKELIKRVYSRQVDVAAVAPHLAKLFAKQ